jgi:hypothetical protein
VVGTDATTWTFALGGLADATTGGVDVILVPGTGAGPFSLSFAKPDAAAFTISPSPSPSPAARPTPADHEPSAATTAGAGDAPATGSPGASGAPIGTFDGSDAVFAAPVSGTAGEAFDHDPSLELSATAAGTDPPEVVAAPAGRTVVPEGTRQPLALLAATLLIAAWVWRTRVAVVSAADHPLAGTLALAGDPGALRRAESLLTAGDDR